VSQEQLAEEVPRPEAPPTLRRSRAFYIVGALGICWLLFGLADGMYQAKLSDVQKNDNAAWLPKSAESTKVDNEWQNFQQVQTIPGFVVYTRDAALTADDKAKIASDVQAFRGLPGVAVDQVGPAQFSVDGRTAAVPVPLIGKQGDVAVKGPDLVDNEKRVLNTGREGAPPGLVIHSAGAGGLLVAFIDAFSGIDGKLILAALFIVIVILLIVYRSPILPFIYPTNQRIPRTQLGRADRLPAGQTQRAHVERAEPGHSLRAYPRRRHRLCAVADQQVPRGTACL
jgi:putative drug exporter of the RND superfamily